MPRLGGDDPEEGMGWALGMYLLICAGNLFVPWMFADPLSTRANSMRAIVLLAGPFLVLLAFTVYSGARSRKLVSYCIGIVLMCVLTVPSIRWSGLGSRYRILMPVKL